MDPILGQLLALTAALRPVVDAAPEALAGLRRFIAAILFQQNPGAAIPADPSLDPPIARALAEGAALATELSAAGVHASFIQDNELTPGDRPQFPARTFGPFIDQSGNIVRFLIFESAPFQAVHVRLPNGNPTPEAILLLSQPLPSQDGNRTLEIPAGSVWIRATFLVRGAAGWVGLRVAGGRLAMSAPASLAFPGLILLPSDTRWTLVLQPEQPPIGEAAGSDANGATLTLPQMLEIGSSAAPAVTGAIGISGFGSDLAFDTPSGDAALNGVAVEFPFSAPGLAWRIAGTRSPAAQLTGGGAAASAAWSLPIDTQPPSTFGEAAHGGSLTVRLSGAISLRLAGMTGGAIRLLGTSLTANARGIRLEAHRPDASGRIDLEFWRPALSRCVFDEPTGRVLFVSERDLGDLALVHEGGILRNRWDRPLAAAGDPFKFDGRLENLAILARGTGLHLLGVANQDPGDRAEGLALENVYLTVRQPRRLVLHGAYDGVGSVPDGEAILSFDVALAQPILPDPYAANWRLEDGDNAQAGGISLTLAWTAASTPQIASRLDRRLSFPEPRDLPFDQDDTTRDRFNEHLHSQREVLSLLDLSSGDHHFGVALETLSDQEPTLTDNRLTVQLRAIRLLMQPQVLWEPVQSGTVEMPSVINDGRTLLGANSVSLVPVLPGVIAEEWVGAAHRRVACAAMFSLPFGIHALARFDPVKLPPIPSIEAALKEVDFGADLTSARQVRLTATGNLPRGKRTDPARSMTGSLKQLRNVLIPGAASLTSVIDDPIVNVQIEALERFLPLHQADLSGYGLSTFSDWRRDDPVGVTQVRFEVMNGRTALEVIQTRTILAPCQAHLVRTVIMERRNSARVVRFDSGWVAADDGLFEKPARFDKGVVIAFRKIRHVRVLTKPPLTLSDGSVWREVLFDCDAELEHLTANGGNGRVPAFDQSGYVQVTPTGPLSAPTESRIAALFSAVNGPIGGSIDCGIRIGGTLEMHVAGVFADAAPHDADPGVSFVVAAFGLPKLPRAGQWSSVRIASGTGQAAPVDERHGIPVVRRDNQPYTFRDPADTYRANPATEYGLLMSTSSSRVLFPRPSVNPLEPRLLRTGAPAVADPLALAQSTGVFPPATYALRCTQLPVFDIAPDNEWRLTNPEFDITAPASNLAKGAEWAIQRAFPAASKFSGIVDSALGTKPWDLGVTPNDLKIDIDPFGTLFTIRMNYRAVSGALPKLQKPTLDFGPALTAVKELVDSLKQFVDLGFDFDVDVAAGSGPSPSFVVRIALRFRIGEGPNERIDIGIGKFYGEFQIHGQLEAALSGSTRGRLLAEFQGDVQQGILPPLLYAGGLFRFALEIRETGRPLIELGLGVTISIGGDLIKNLIEVEVTIKYGYTLIPETLQPGVLLGLEARAKLLGGLIGFSFGVQAMARIQRADLENVTIFADLRVVASVQVAWLIEEDIDIRTQFEQTIPLRIAAIAVGGGALAMTAPL